jgi:meso-butanediol dehydrogenase / (S,S)-butanediol dehydrogenase / diacetyl reductase
MRSIELEQSMHRGQVVLVTGAASGIGRATSEWLATRGAVVAGVDRDERRLRDVMAPMLPGGSVAIVADISDADAAMAAVGDARARLGGLHAVVNVAGVGGYTGDVSSTSPAAWRSVIDVDLTGVFLVCRAAVPHLRTGGGGAIVNVGSQYGLVGGAGCPAYIAAKAGVIGLTRAMAIDHAEDGICVNCVCPGPVDTPMRSASTTSSWHDREAARTVGRLPAGRPASPAEIASVIAFLISDDARYMTGSVASVDGGWTAA